MSSVPTVGYWDLKGRGEPIRLLLHYSGVKFNDKRYSLERREDWFSVKPDLGFDFPNLPYYIEGDLKLTQFLAIMRYLGQKHGLIATDLKSSAVQDMIEQQLYDMSEGMRFIFLDKSEDIEEKKRKYVSEKLEPQLQSFSKFLGKNQWFVSGSLTYIDFLANSLLEKLKELFPETITKYPAIDGYITRFQKLPAIKQYF